MHFGHATTQAVTIRSQLLLSTNQAQTTRTTN